VNREQEGEQKNTRSLNQPGLSCFGPRSVELSSEKWAVLQRTNKKNGREIRGYAAEEGGTKFDERQKAPIMENETRR